MFCMFKHEADEDHDYVDELENSGNDHIRVTDAMEEENDVNADESSKIIEIVDVDDIENGNDPTFINPSQFDNLLSAQVFKCEICDFESSTQICISNHKEAIHNWCSLCYSSLKSKEKLKNHKKKKHTLKSKLTGLAL
jgi:hypothetical protein